MRSCSFPIPGSRSIGLVMCLLAAGCASPTPQESATDPELARVATTARLAFDGGSAEQAARLYARSLAMARAVDDSLEIGNNAYNLAACLIAIDRYGDAREYLSEARREFERAHRDPAPVILLDAKAARLQGKADEALALADQVLATTKGETSDSYKVQVALLKAEVACDRSDAAAAKTAMAVADKTMASVSDPALSAVAANVAARINLVENDPGKAAMQYDRETEFYRQARKYHDMALAMGRAGRAYLDAGILTPAEDRLYRAARTLFGQGDELGALKLIEPALNAADKAGDKDAALRATALFKEIKESVESTAKAVAGGPASTAAKP